MSVKQYFGYLVNHNGQIYSPKTNKFIKPALDKDGYEKVTLQNSGEKEYWRVHRLVASLFIPNPDNKPEINHIDGNKRNNHFTNLEWVTTRENIIHSWESGLKHKNYNQDQLNEINRQAVKKHYDSISDIEKENRGKIGKSNNAYGKNYLKDKTDKERESIRQKKIAALNANKHNHMDKNGSPIMIDGILYKSINEASKILGFSFKYIKRRILSKDYENFVMIGE